MSMSWSEHVKQAELLLREAEQDLAAERTQQGLQRIDISVQIALTHAVLADAKRVVK
jgi:hypothetical protein